MKETSSLANSLSPLNDSELSKKEFPSIRRSPSQAEQYPAFSLPGSIDQPQTSYISPYFDSSYDFPWNPDKLTQGNTYKIYDEMKDDDQIKACISFKKDICLSSGWKIVCEDEEVRQFIENNLKEGLEEYELGKSFEDVVRDMLSAYEYGFSLTEPVFQINPESKYEIKCLKVRPPHSFRFNIDSYGNILTITQSTDSRGELELVPNKFIHHVYQQEYGNPYGKSDLKSAHTAWAAKKFFTRFYGMYVERFASPTVVGKYDKNMTGSEVSRFYNLLKTLQNSTTYTIPEDTNLEFIQANRDATDTYIKGLDMFNMWISRSILVPDLLGVSGSKTSGGSYSLGQTQYKLFLTTIEKERKNLQRKITMRLIRPLVNVNFGDIPCAFEFNPITMEDELEYHRLWSDFTKSRIVKPSEEEINYFRKSMKYPEGPVELQQPPANPLEKVKDGENDDEGEGKEQEEKMSLRTFREKNKYETQVNFTEIKSVLESSQAKATSNIRRAAKVIQADLVEQIVSQGIIKSFRPDAINSIQPRFLKDLNQVFSDHFTELFKKSYNMAQKEFFPSAVKKFSDAEILPEEFLEIIRAEAFKNVGDYSIEITKKAKNVLVNGIKSGLSEAKIVQMIREEMAEASERWMETVVRTKTTEMFNEARKTYWETDEIAKEIVEAYEFSAIMDDRVSDVCAELDGKIFEKGDFIDRVTPPLHFNCRSVLVPITKYQEYKLDKEPSIESLQKLGGGLIV